MARDTNNEVQRYCINTAFVGSASASLAYNLWRYIKENPGLTTPTRSNSTAAWMALIKLAQGA